MSYLHSILLIALALLQQKIVQSDHISSPLKVQLHENKISQHNNSAYVRQIMRLSKAAEIRNYMQMDADACDNFFEYACGNWRKINPADGQSPRETNFFELLTNTYNQKQLKFVQEAKRNDDGIVESKVKDFFEACLQLGGIKKRQLYKMKLREIIAEFGIMPALVKEEIWLEAMPTFDWLQTIAKIQNKYGLNIILQMGIKRDFNNRTMNKLFIGQAGLRLQTKSMYQNEATKWHRAQYVLEIKKNLMQFLNVPETLATVTANEILQFEVALSKGIIDNRSSKTFKSIAIPRTLDEIQAAYAPTIDLKQYIVQSLGHEPNATFYEYAVDYQENLVDVIQNATKAQLANYIYYQLVQVFFYNTELPKVKREKVCLEKTKSVFAKVLDNVIFRRYNNAATVRDINIIWQKIKQTFLEELESEKLSWISLITRKLAIEKLQAMQLEINAYEDQNFTVEYAALHIDRLDFIHNLKAVLEFETARELASLYEPPKPTESALMLSYSPAYIAVENLIKIPVSLLQPNYLWSDYYPNALKFGTLGYLVAHELIHGFDDMGRHYDLKGNDFTWWDQNSTDAFNERKQCFKTQYARYRYGGKYLPESELQAENIADNGAIQVAYSAYMHWLHETEQQLKNATEQHHKQEFIIERLPNLNFTNKQLFFISFAQFWCNDVNERLKDKVALIDVHAPAMYRVIGTLANFNEFSKQFQCAKGTTMNPNQRCQIY